MRNDIYSKSDLSVLDISNIGYSPDPAVTKYVHGKRWLYIIHYVISGKGYFNDREVFGGQGFLITPGMDEEYHPDPRDPWEFLWIISSDEGMEKIIPHLGADPDTGIFNHNATEEVKLLAEDVCRNNKHFYSSCEMLEKFLRILNAHKSRRDAPEGSAADNYFEFSLNYINANLHTGVKISALTELLGITQVYLYKIFMAKLGQSPKQYIEAQKFSKAKKMLLETELPIASIAESVGYDDPLAFSKFFSRRTGLFPQKYRLKHKERRIDDDD